MSRLYLVVLLTMMDLGISSVHRAAEIEYVRRMRKMLVADILFKSDMADFFRFSLPCSVS